jgi:hypothetical protein
MTSPLRDDWRPPVFLDDVTISALQAEIVAAQSKHGWHNTPLNPTKPDERSFIILSEEIGEVARALTYDHPELGPDHLVKELIQVAAMALAWVEGIEARP